MMIFWHTTVPKLRGPSKDIIKLLANMAQPASTSSIPNSIHTKSVKN